MIRKSSTITDVWEFKRVELYLAQLEAASDDRWRFLDLLELLVYFLIDDKTKSALQDDDYAYVKDISKGRLLHVIDEFNTRFPKATIYVKFYGKDMSALDLLAVILKTYKV